MTVKRSKVNLQGRGNIVADSRTSFIFINSLISMEPTAIGSKERAGRRRRKGWAAAGPQRPVLPTAGGGIATRTACMALQSAD